MKRPAPDSATGSASDGGATTPAPDGARPCIRRQTNNVAAGVGTIIRGEVPYLPAGDQITRSSFQGYIVSSATGKRIKCYVCREHIQEENPIIVHLSGSGHSGRWGVQHTNCSTAAQIAENENSD